MKGNFRRIQALIFVQFCQYKYHALILKVKIQIKLHPPARKLFLNGYKQKMFFKFLKRKFKNFVFMEGGMTHTSSEFATIHIDARIWLSFIAPCIVYTNANTYVQRYYPVYINANSDFKRSYKTYGP